MPEAAEPNEQHGFSRLLIPADLAELPKVRGLMGEVGRRAGLPDNRIFDLQVSVSEATANAIEHAASGVQIDGWRLPDRVIVEVTNDGGFQPGLCKDVEGRRRGLGLPLMVSLADQVHVLRLPGDKTRVSLTFFLEGYRQQASGPDPVGEKQIHLGDVESLYRNLVDLSPDAILVHIDGTYVFANPAAARLFGARSPDELIGMKAIERLHPDDRELMARRMSQVLGGGVAPTVEGRMLRLDGTPISVESTGSRVQFGGSLAIQAVIRDITERKRAERYISDLSKRLTHHIEQSPLAVIEWGPDMRLVRWSGDAEGIFGWRADEVLGKRIEDLRWVYQTDQAHVAEVSSDLQTGTNRRRFSANRNYRKDGSVVDCEWYNSSLLDGEGRLQSILSLVLDVTARKRAEQEAEEQQRLLLTAQKDYDLLFSGMLDGLAVHEIILDEREEPCDYRFLAVNPAFEKLTGLCATDIVGKTVLEVLPGLERSWIERYGRVALTGEEIHFESHAASLGRQYEVTAYRPEEGRFATIFHDVTDRKRAETTLLRLNRTLAAHSASDQALIRATDESSYLADVCRIVVEDCGHAMVWIGYKEDDEYKSVRPVASAGFEEGYLETLQITWADRERGRGPTGTAVRTGRPSGCRNMLTDPAVAPWRGEALRRGYASSIAVPLLQGGTALGAITIYSSEPDPFSDDEVGLLAALADDLALGITTLRLRTAHAEAEREREILLAEEQQLTEELQAQNEELRASRYNRTLIEASLDPLVTIGLDGTITDVNEATVKITGYSREELIGTDFSDYFTAPESARSGYREAFTNGSVTDYPLTVRDRDGRLTDVLYNATVYRDQDGEVLGVFAAARDISALRELEEQRAIASTLQNALLDIPQETSSLRFSHLYRSATREASVGGDFYDVFKVKNDRLAVLIGDVSGHGVEAARVSILVKDVVHAFAHQFGRPGVVLGKTNDLLLEKRIPGFVSVFLGIIDPHTGLLKYSSAGHPPALLRKRWAEVQALEAGSAPVGVFAGHSWKDRQVRLEKEDLLLLYTDGMTEARRNGQFFGQEGLAKALARWRNPSLELLPQALLDEMLAFSRSELRDDVAMLAVSLTDR